MRQGTYLLISNRILCYCSYKWDVPISYVTSQNSNFDVDQTSVNWFWKDQSSSEFLSSGHYVVKGVVWGILLKPLMDLD